MHLMLLAALFIGAAAALSSLQAHSTARASPVVMAAAARFEVCQKKHCRKKGARRLTTSSHNEALIISK